jgi:NTE family protein
MGGREGDGKLGLALSGGGFRASFFHIGVLARLAELGVLRQVEVLSTVSGGSIVGAAYYLRVKELLEREPDAEIRDSDYVELVHALELDFTAVVKTSIRSRALANPFKNLRMLLSRDYSRSERIGDLYDREFYKPIWKQSEGDRERRWRGYGPERPIELRELIITPKGTPDGARFRPDVANPDRAAKVPILLLNATTLNTGHNWRFEAVRMGEPEHPEATAALVDDIDKNRRLAQGWFDPEIDQDLGVVHPDVGEANRDFPLGLAVAASASVPGVFHPLSVDGMYDGARVQLVDGGVHDNQGVQGLADAGCERLIVSDASGQMKDRAKPAPLLPSVLLRSNSIYGDRVRDEQLLHAHDSDRPVALMHLRKGLARRTVQPGDPFDGELSEPAGDVTEFGVSRRVQRALSEIRTDLDSFSDIESQSLALDGYLMTSANPELNGSDPAFATLRSSEPVASDPRRWRFTAVADRIGSEDEAYLRHLRAGNRKFLRVLWIPKAGPVLARLGYLVQLLFVAALVAAVVLAAVPGIEWVGDRFEGRSLGWLPFVSVLAFAAWLGLVVAIAFGGAIWAWSVLAASWLTRGVGQVRSSRSPPR